MKKSIKYAGIAAATLLTVAPIAAPVVSNVTTVKADSSDAQTDASKLATALKNDFTDKYGDKKASELSANIGSTTLQLGSGNAMSYKNFISTATAKVLSSDNAALVESPLLSDNTNTNDANVRNVYISASDSNNSNITNTTDLKAILDDKTQPVVTFTLHYTYTDTNGATQTGTKTFQATRNNDADITSVKATFTTPLTVALNSTITSSVLTSNANVSIKDQNGDGITTGSTTLAPVYYYTYANAMNNAATANGDATNGSVTSDVISNDTPAKFKKAGTYYQAITVKAVEGSELAKFIADYQKDPTSNPIYINGNLASSGYDFKVSPDGTSLTFVRAIKVSDSESTWTVEQNKGIVTTKSDKDSYTLKNDDNETISDRALAKNSAWVTDQKRTDQNGNVQYRVATGEWIPAENVTFSDKTADTGYTDVKALNGKVATAGPAGYYYPLFDDNGKQISNRGVSGLTEWYTDKSAVNADGVTVYHVATGEWLQGTNVTYTAY